MERYQKIEKNGHCGEGTYGVVYKAKDKQTEALVALKRIRLEVEDEGIPSTTLREIAVLRQLRHPNIVELNNVVQEDGKLYLVFEFVDKDLKKYFEATEGPLPWNLIKDLKPQNILVSRDGRLKIADFVVTLWYRPPRNLAWPLFPGDSEIDELYKIFRVSRLVPGISDAGIDLLENLIQMDPKRRLSALEALRHPYFDDMASN
eukprot:GSChrysophyteH1.ASY1.ANO1.993.1 assembled CDS